MLNGSTLYVNYYSKLEKIKMKETDMVEKVYKTMKSVGIGNLVLGICMIVLGVGVGVAIIVNGARLLHKKSDLLF